MKEQSKINVFIIGARGYVKMYAGWTALIHGICENQKDKNIQYYVYEVADTKADEGIEKVDNVIVIRRCFNANSGFGMIKADAFNTLHAVKFIKKHKISNPIILFLGLRIGPLAYMLRPYMRSSGAVIMENAAGVEWKRPKWGKIAQLYMRISAYFMARATDYLICDARGIKDIYNKMIPWKRPNKVFIPYGSYPPILIDPSFPPSVKEYFDKWNITPGEYYVIVNRFMPENSYEMILSQYVQSDTKKDLILVTNNDKEHEYYEELAKRIPFEKDKRIKFVGTMYDKEILSYLRQCAFAYINGHTLGGTNPGLLEAMASTGLVLCHNNIFSHEVCGNLSIYYDEKHTLGEAIKKCESLSASQREIIIRKSREKMQQKYAWNDVTEKYESLFRKAIANKRR